jgi:hypothetical protein
MRTTAISENFGPVVNSDHEGIRDSVASSRTRNKCWIAVFIVMIAMVLMVVVVHQHAADSFYGRREYELEHRPSQLSTTRSLFSSTVSFGLLPLRLSQFSKS